MTETGTPLRDPIQWIRGIDGVWRTTAIIAAAPSPAGTGEGGTTALERLADDLRAVSCEIENAGHKAWTDPLMAAALELERFAPGTIPPLEFQELFEASDQAAGFPADEDPDGFDAQVGRLFIKHRRALQSMICPAPPSGPGGEGLLSDYMLDRLDSILTPESPMHPIGCSTWEEAAREAVNTAKERLSSAQAEIDRLKAEVARLKLAICGGTDVPGAIAAVTVVDCERFCHERELQHGETIDRARATEAREAGLRVAAEAREVGLREALDAADKRLSRPDWTVQRDATRMAIRQALQTEGEG